MICERDADLVLRTGGFFLRALNRKRSLCVYVSCITIFCVFLCVRERYIERNVVCCCGDIAEKELLSMSLRGREYMIVDMKNIFLSARYY